jgi:hypothetical protein
MDPKQIDLVVVDAIDSLLADRTAERHLSKEDVLTRLCKLCATVQHERFDYSLPADCFCGHDRSVRYLFDAAIIEFIEATVAEKLAQSPTPKESQCPSPPQLPPR